MKIPKSTHANVTDNKLMLNIVVNTKHVIGQSKNMKYITAKTTTKGVSSIKPMPFKISMNLIFVLSMF